jgi:hypothetical protein
LTIHEDATLEVAMTQFKNGDRVVIHPWRTRGVVVHTRPDSNPEDSIYQVQADPYYFRENDLEPEPPKPDLKTRRREIDKLTERLRVVSEKVKTIREAGAEPDVNLSMEMFRAYDDLGKALGYNPIVVPIDPNPLHRK